MNTLWSCHTLWSHGTGRTCRAGWSRNTSDSLRPNIALRACRAGRTRWSRRPLWSHISLRAFTSRITFRSYVATNTLDTLNTLWPRITSRPRITPWPRISGRSYRTCISSGTSCTRCPRNALGTHRPWFASVALRSGTACIPFDPLRPHRPLITLRTGRPPFTTGWMTLLLTAVTLIILIHSNTSFTKYL